MTEIDMKYGFPLFTLPSSLVSLGKNEKLIISDIWAFWDYVIKKVSKDKKESNFLKSLLEQSKHFHLTAENSPVRSQPLLYYYSFLNFSKILINLNAKHGTKKTYMHGMTAEHKDKFIHSTVTKQRQKTGVVQVAHELISIFNPDTPSEDIALNVRDLLNHCVGVHRSYSEIYNQTEIFHKITDAKLYKNGRQLIFKSKIQCPISSIKSLSKIGYTLEQDENNLVYYIEKIDIASYTPTRKDFANLSNKINKNGIWYFIGNNGYTTYLSHSEKHRFSQEAIIYMTMFYLGSITRYHPYMFDKIFSDKEQWLMSEFLSTQPKQFLYLATAKVLGQSVLKAYSSF